MKQEMKVFKSFKGLFEPHWPLKSLGKSVNMIINGSDCQYL